MPDGTKVLLERAELLRRGTLFLVVAAGGACSLAWFLAANAALVWQQARAFAWGLALPAIALTLTNVLLRLLRWQFFLRRGGVRLPMRQSTAIFVAGLAMLLTPAYAGEGVKTWLVGKAQPGRWPRAAGTVVAERLADAVALALLGGTAFLLAGEPALGMILAGAGVTGVALAGAVTPGVARRHLGTALLLSLLAWLAGCLTLYAVCRGLRLDVTPAQATGTYSAATLLGGLTLLPAGVGVVGTAMLIKLQGYGASLQQAVLAAALVRLFTVWLTAGLGAAGCWHLGWQWVRSGHPEPAARSVGVPADREPDHFDALAPDYAGQLSTAARERVVERKVALMRRSLAGAGIAPGARLLDAGCGQGWYTLALAQAGYRLTGVDLAPGQLRFARAAVTGAEPTAVGRTASAADAEAGAPATSGTDTEGGAPVGGAAEAASGAGDLVDGFAAATLLALPFPPATFDAAFAVNVLHHVGDGHDQDAALAELTRVVRPGGLVFVHEITTVNPLFRLYMAYLFPLWKRIDLGTEFWLDPRRPPRAPGAALDGLRYYTFLPDFTPRALYRFLGPVERWLERTPCASYAAHFTAIYRRLPDGPGAQEGTGLAPGTPRPSALATVSA